MSETLRYRISDISTDTCRQVSRPFITVTLLNVVGGFVAYSCPVMFTSHREQAKKQRLTTTILADQLYYELTHLKVELMTIFVPTA
ncbi:hypothetical protein J6590_088137 [Homalodisca vitripennis]|nr:hypothetical protein J6590_088137 [Homalodisca vitripennis]